VDALLARPLGLFDSPRSPLRLPLPDPGGWRESAERSSFLVLEHPASSSRLLVRLWHEDANMTREECERRARLGRDLPPSPGATSLSRERVDVPSGFDTVAEAGVSTAGQGAPIGGHVVAFGGWAHQCFSYVFTTSVAGPRAEQIVAARLALMRDESLARLTVRSDLEPPPRPAPAVR
jgi:hypothetical protein